jgi:hypothetical protein
MIAGPALDYTHAYKPIMKICCAVAAAGTIFFVVHSSDATQVH